MRRLVIVSLIALETLVGGAVVACSVELAQTLATSRSIATVAHAIVHSTHRLASLELRLTVRRGA